MDTFFSVVSLFLSSSWDFFTETSFPGLPGVTIGALSVALFLAVLGIRLVSYLFSFQGGGDTPRTSSTRHPKISKERRGDEF